MDLVFIALFGSVLALLFAGANALTVKKADIGNDRMKTISSYIKTGANAYLKRQYGTVVIFFAAVFILLFVLSWTGLLSKFTPYAFLSGGLFSGLSGFLGMKIATAANARTAQAASKSLNKGLRVAFSAGSVMGFVVVGLGLLDIAVWYIILKYGFNLAAHDLTTNMITFGVGASSMALFARVGGGIFTKAADVGADLVGKVEAGIPEDDPRNPAAIADNVGDNVGDVAGMGADLYESYVGSIVSCMALAAAIPNSSEKMIILPLLIAALGILGSIIGTFFVRTKENASQKQLLSSLRTGTIGSAVILALGSMPLIYYMIDDKSKWLGIYISVLAGLVAGVLIGICTEYFTSDSYKPTKDLAKSSSTGSATLIISGLGLGFMSTIAPIIIVCATVLTAFFVCGGAASSNEGLFGIAIAAVGMLSTLGITLATDAYGPVADNAGGIAQMAGLDENVRSRTDALDSLGNTTAATGKGFAIGSAALTALALLASFTNQVDTVAGGKFDWHLEVTNPLVLVGLFIGGMLPFVFSALAIGAVGKAAQSIVVEVRRQFAQIKGIMLGTETPDYARCIDLCTKSSLRKMILPSLLAVISPIAIGLLLGPDGVVGMLAGATVTGFLLAIMMSNSGGAWDNAKKYVEGGQLGGKNSDAHKATVVGDTVGDPLKDTAGPSINILIKLLSIIAIVFAEIIVTYSLF